MFPRSLSAAAASLSLAAIGQAQTYYSVDVTNDLLCAVDVNTGVATALGPLQADLTSVDLAWHQGALYAKTFGGPAGNKVCQVVTNGQWIGFALQGNFLNGGTYLGAEAAGIASDGNGLYLTYSHQAPPNNFSLRFGRVEPIWSGTIAWTANLTQDTDAMGFAGGQFWGVDVINSSSGYKLYRGTSATGPTTWVGGDTYDPATNPVDVEAYSGTDLVAISQSGQNLVFVSRTNGTRTLVRPVTGLVAGGVLSGIARSPSPCPRPITFP
jgi:hypothetical protein